MKVKYFVRQGQSDRPNINARITCGRKLDVRKALPLTVQRKYWSSNGTIKGRHLPPDVEKVRTKLMEFENALQSAYTDILNTEEPLSLRWVENVMDSFFTGGKRQEGYEYLTDFMKVYIDELPKKLIPKGNGKRYSDNTVKNYTSTYNMLLDFEGHRKIRLLDADISFHNSFLDYCYTDLDLGVNTISNYIKNIKSILKQADKAGLKVCQDYKSEDFYRPRDEELGTEIYLTESELDEIWSYKTQKQSLVNARDWLILSCETGLRISDLLNPTDRTKSAFKHALNELKKPNRRMDIIRLKLKTRKTNGNSEVPLLERSAKILLRNEGLPRSTSDVNYNIYVKELCKNVGLTQFVDGSKMIDIGNKRFRKRHDKFPKYELVSSHIGRRTYITNAYLRGVDPVSIMKVSGHKSMEQLEQYIKMTSEDSFESLQRMHLSNRLDISTRMEVNSGAA